MTNLSSLGSFSCVCAKWLSDWLSELRHHETCVKDTLTFLSLRQSRSSSEKIMTSFDVTGLFANVPVDFTINLILDSVFRRSDEFNGLNRRPIKKLLEWVVIVKTTPLPFNGRFYRQVDGIAMGSPIAPLMADVCLNHVIDQALVVTPPECRPDLLCRYVDDLFLLFPNEDSLNRFFTNINSVQSWTVGEPGAIFTGGPL